MTDEAAVDTSYCTEVVQRSALFPPLWYLSLSALPRPAPSGVITYGYLTDCLTSRSAPFIWSAFSVRSVRSSARQSCTLNYPLALARQRSRVARHTVRTLTLPPPMMIRCFCSNFTRRKLRVSWQRPLTAWYRLRTLPVRTSRCARDVHRHSRCSPNTRRSARVVRGVTLLRNRCVVVLVYVPARVKASLRLIAVLPATRLSCPDARLSRPNSAATPNLRVVPSYWCPVLCQLATLTLAN